MTTIHVKMDVSEWVAYMKNLGPRFMPGVLTGIRAGAAGCVSVMQQRTTYAPPASDKGSAGAVDTGLFRAAWQSTSTPTGAFVYNSRAYAGVIEYGRRARTVGRQGIEQLTRWAHRKLGLSGGAAESAAFAIARSMSPSPYGKGRVLRPRKVMVDGLPEMLKRVHEEIESALIRVLGRKV